MYTSVNKSETSNVMENLLTQTAIVWSPGGDMRKIIIEPC